MENPRLFFHTVEKTFPHCGKPADPAPPPPVASPRPPAGGESPAARAPPAVSSAPIRSSPHLPRRQYPPAAATPDARRDSAAFPAAAEFHFARDYAAKSRRHWWHPTASAADFSSGTPQFARGCNHAAGAQKRGRLAPPCRESPPAPPRMCRERCASAPSRPGHRRCAPPRYSESDAVARYSAETVGAGGARPSPAIHRSPWPRREHPPWRNKTAHPVFGPGWPQSEHRHPRPARECRGSDAQTPASSPDDAEHARARRNRPRR